MLFISQSTFFKPYFNILSCLLIALIGCSIAFAETPNNKSGSDSLRYRDGFEKNQAEPDNKPFSIGLDYKYGFMMAHARELANVRGTHPQTLDLKVGWLLNTRETWDDCHCIPRVGFFFSYHNYDSPKILKNGYTAGLTMTYIIGLPSKFNFILDGKAGVSYLTNPYDRESEEQLPFYLRNSEQVNWAYSSHFNYLLVLGFGIRAELGKAFEVQFLASMNHMSNAALTEPTSGLNYPGISMGLTTTLSPVKIKQRSHPDPYLVATPKKRWDLIFSAGTANMPFPDEAKVPFYSFNVMHSLQIHRMGARTLGFELEMDGRAGLEADRGQRSLKYPYRGSLQIGYEFLMGRTTFGLQLGYYVFAPFPYRGSSFYQRYGAVYRVFKRIRMGFNFKSIGHYADHLDLRVVYSF